MPAPIALFLVNTTVTSWSQINKTEGRANRFSVDKIVARSKPSLTRSTDGVSDVRPLEEKNLGLTQLADDMSRSEPYRSLEAPFSKVFLIIPGPI